MLKIAPGRSPLSTDRFPTQEKLTGSPMNEADNPFGHDHQAWGPASSKQVERILKREQRIS